MSALASPYIGDDDEPATAACAGPCGRRLRVTLQPKNGGSDGGNPRAFSEDRDTFGRRRYWCRRCTGELWRRSE